MMRRSKMVSVPTTVAMSPYIQGLPYAENIWINIAYGGGDQDSDIPLRTNRNGKMPLTEKFLVSSADCLFMMKPLIKITTVLVVRR
jgi:hypothetical protein